jgi:DNA-binding MarR family transcriptional regulator
MMNAPREKINSLNTNELQYFRSEKTIRRFADNESLEKRILMLARLGYSYCLTMAPEGSDLTVFEDIPEQFKNGDRLDIVRAMGEKRIFVLSSRDVLMGLHMAAQNSHSQVYVLNYDYVHLRQTIHKSRVTTLNDNTRDSVEAFDELSKLVLATLSLQQGVEALIGLEEKELRVLLALLPFRSTYIGFTKVVELMQETGRSISIGVTLDRLAKKGYLDRMKGARDVKLYTIMEKGIDAAMTFLKYIVKSAN